jgi:hypothetical protein
MSDRINEEDTLANSWSIVTKFRVDTKEDTHESLEWLGSDSSTIQTVHPRTVRLLRPLFSSDVTRFTHSATSPWSTPFITVHEICSSSTTISLNVGYLSDPSPTTSRMVPMLHCWLPRGSGREPLQRIQQLILMWHPFSHSLPMYYRRSHRKPQFPVSFSRGIPVLHYRVGITRKSRADRAFPLRLVGIVTSTQSRQK